MSIAFSVSSAFSVTFSPVRVAVEGVAAPGCDGNFQFCRELFLANIIFVCYSPQRAAVRSTSTTVQ